MNDTLKRFLMISLKNAVNAILTNAALMATMSGWFHVHSWTGIQHILMATGSVVLSREAMVWGPKILKWSTSGLNSE